MMIYLDALQRRGDLPAAAGELEHGGFPFRGLLLGGGNRGCRRFLSIST